MGLEPNMNQNAKALPTQKGPVIVTTISSPKYSEGLTPPVLLHEHDFNKVTGPGEFITFRKVV